MKESISISRSIFNPTRTGNGFNKIKRTGNGFRVRVRKHEREILFEATRTGVWLKLDVSSMCVRLATQQRDTSDLINHQALVAQNVDNAIHRINHYPVDSVVCFVDTYPLDSNLSGG